MDEKKIIKEILAGDTDQYRFLLQRYQPGLIHHCFAMVHSQDIAKDIAQEACIKAYFQLKKYKNTYRFSTWLYTIATHLCLDFLKKRRHISLDDIVEPAVGSPSLQEQLVQDEASSYLHRAIQNLPLKYQTVISLYYWQDQRYEEIAKIMNIPLGTVRTWLRRAKEQLKEELHGQV